VSLSVHKLAASLLTACIAICLIKGFAQRKPDSKKTATLPVPPFIIQAELSNTAEEKLHQLHEGITVLAMFDGDALPAYRKDNAPMRDVVLGSDEIPADGEHIAAFTNAHISQIDWTHLSDKNYFLTINIFTSRKANPNNLLDCQVPEDHLSKFANKTTVVKCKLIGESDTPSTNSK
jgi:hypothetical protein